MAPLTTRSIFFDLDNTLFDHYHSLRCAVSAVQNNCPGLAGIQTQELVDQYNKALQKAYDSYLDKEMTYEETESQKVKLFFGALGLPEPTLEDIKDFRAIYKPVYRANRRATPGSVETLARLRENGYQTAIITNGQVEDQSAKAKAIGIHHLVDRIITSEEAGYRKPDIRIFQYAMEQLGASPNTTYMIGDSANSDIRGALDTQLTAILYSPMSRDSTKLLFGQEVSVISHMGQLLSQLGIATRNFHPQFELTSGRLVVQGIGIDIVTEPRHCLSVSQDTVRLLTEKMGLVLVAISTKRYIAAMSYLEHMIRAIAEASTPINAEDIIISFPAQGYAVGGLVRPESRVMARDHSICGEYVQLTLDVMLEQQSVLHEVTILLQSHCDYLMKDYPRMAIRQLRSAMLIMAKEAGVERDTVIAGEQIDE